MNKKKILFLLESLSGGGAEKVLTTLLQHINYNYFDVTLCCICNVGKYLNEINSNVHYTFLLPNPNNLTRFQKFIYQINYKLIYHWLPLKWIYQCFIPHHADTVII